MTTARAAPEYCTPHETAVLLSLVETDLGNDAAICAALAQLEHSLAYSHRASAGASGSAPPQSPWLVLGAHTVPELRSALAALMQLGCGRPCAVQAAHLFSLLLQCKGRDAHRACDGEASRALVGVLRALSRENASQAQCDRMCLGLAAIADVFCTVEEAVLCVAHAGQVFGSRTTVVAMAELAGKNPHLVLSHALGVATNEASTACSLDWCAQVVSLSASSSLCLAFCQHLAVRASDASAAVRHQALALIAQLAPQGVREFARVLSASTATSRRAFACDLAGALFCAGARAPGGGQGAAGADAPLLALVQARARDRFASVRQAALRACADMLAVQPHPLVRGGAAGCELGPR
jgi:hypothetical protein